MPLALDAREGSASLEDLSERWAGQETADEDQIVDVRSTRTVHTISPA